MLNIFKAKEFLWSLFIGHLCIEKLLKALYVKRVDVNIPRVHDLLKIATRIDIDIPEDTKDKLQLITSFNIEARYEIHKQSIYKKCNEEYTEKVIQDIEELRLWLLKQIQN